MAGLYGRRLATDGEQHFISASPTATEAAEAPRRERDLVPSGLFAVIHIDRLAGGADQKVVAPVSRATLP